MSMFIERQGTGALKYDGVKAKFGRVYDDTLSMWIADMDVLMPPPVAQVLADQARHPVVGYCRGAIDDAVTYWLSRHGQQVEADTIVPLDNVVNALYLCVDLFSEPGDTITVFTPVYAPIMQCVTGSQRQLHTIPLTLQGQGIDFDPSLLRSDVAAMIICQPHNPTGGMYSQQQLQQLTAFCHEHNITLISDEVHADFVFEVATASLLALPDATRQTVVSLRSAAKSFNLASVDNAAYALVADPKRREQLSQAIEARHLVPSWLACAILNRAYSQCEDWFDELMLQLKVNRKIVRDAPLAQEFSIWLGPGTYFAWLNATALGKQAEQIMFERYRLALGPGSQYGAPGYFRLNLATHPGYLQQVLARLAP